MARRAIAVGYAIYTLTSRGAITKSVLPLAVVSVLLIMLARVSDAVQRWSVITAALLVCGAAQFGYFASDYFTDYRLRTQTVFGSNMRGAVEAAIKTADVTAGQVRVSRAIPFADYYVRLYSAMAGRAQFADGVTYFFPESTAIGDTEPPAVFLTGLGKDDRAFMERCGLSTIATIADPSGSTAYLLSRRQ